MDYSTNFITKKQIEKAIELPFIDIHELLSRYVYFKGLVWSGEHVITYVDGYFIIETTEVAYYEFTHEEVESEYYLTQPDTPVTEMLVAIKGTEFSNNPDLIDEILCLKGSKEIEVDLYSYEQLCQLMKKLGCPEPKCQKELSKKEFTYDVKLLNQKSNFILNDAAKIAANTYYTSHSPYISQLSQPLEEHYLELLSDCIKGTNQHNFKLHTIELWCSKNDEFGERYSTSYDNGTYLKQKADLDRELTLISKREFIRWCEYENIDTGLTFEAKDIEESVEALQAENKKLKAIINQKVYQPPLPGVLNKDDSKKLEHLAIEVKSLKENSFPIMTSKLQAILEAQKKYWLDYSSDSLPTQQSISNFIAEKLELKVTPKGTNRTADELAKAIQPNDIKRK